jgi:hypothetical protein
MRYSVITKNSRSWSPLHGDFIPEFIKEKIFEKSFYEKITRLKLFNAVYSFLIPGVIEKI